MGTVPTGAPPVKLEIGEDFLEEEHGPHTKRSRSSSPFYDSSSSSAFDQLDAGNTIFPLSPSQYNPLDEPSPLGLRLRKSPSLLDLIQMKLSQSNVSPVAAAPSQNHSFAGKRDTKTSTTVGASDKLKASNFIAAILRIGSWEYVSRYEGDLVGKCYFAKHKLVWEVLQSGLKSKIEIQWSDIMALKANCPDNGPGTLSIVLSRQPLFFRETNPQPRKHTLWQASGDFTDGQASRYRQHFLQCPPGSLNKHYEKLIQCDMRLKLLSQQPEIVLDSPYFEAQASVSETPDEPKVPNRNQFCRTSVSTAASSSSSSFLENSEQQDPLPNKCDPKGAPSPSSVMDACAIEGIGNVEVRNFQGSKGGEQHNIPGLHPSMSMNDLVNHIGNHITEQVSSGNMPSEQASECQDMLKNIAEVLLSDTHNPNDSDEKCLMKRVDSLCCLLQDPSAASSLQTQVGETHSEGSISANQAGSNHSVDYTHEKNGERSEENLKEGTLGPPMSRKDSFGDLLLHLPRIASLPKFLFDIAEDDCNQR